MIKFTNLPKPHNLKHLLAYRNNLWLRRNPWFEAEVIPYLQGSIIALLLK